MRIAVLGATGYIGTRLVPRLAESGHQVRCIARSPRKLRDRPWRNRDGIEVVEGDLSNRARLAASLAGIEAIYYLVHAMHAGPAFAQQDRDMAARVAGAARDAGIARVIYLGGLGDNREGLSPHLASRREVEGVLASTGIPVTTFRAAMIIGSGSASFEILRYLTERLPVMVTPRWVRTECQPIAVRDVLHYLVACLTVPATTGRVIEIGGADRTTYRDLFRSRRKSGA